MRASKNDTQVVADYESYTTSRGVTLEVYPVPQKIISGIVPKTPKPKRPEIEMQLPKGQVQKRFLKKDDPGWDDYQELLEEWNQEKDDLQEAVTFCFAFKTFKYPDNLTFSPEVQELITQGLLKVPDNPYLKKFMWIRENLLGQHDELQVTWIINKLSGVPEEMVEQMKENFRRAILGQGADTVGNGTQNNGSEEDSQE